MNRYIGNLETDVYGISADEGRIAHLVFADDETVAADADGIHAAISGKVTAQTITEEIANPPRPRNIVVTPGGTTGDVKACEVIIYGTDIAGNTISEEFTFDDDASTAVTGSKAFKTITRIDIPVQDGTGCTFTIGYGVMFGLPFKFTEKPLTFAVIDNAIETTAPTLAISGTVIASNTISFNTSPAGKKTDVYFVL